jgi:hypothetical protein
MNITILRYILLIIQVIFTNISCNTLNISSDSNLSVIGDCVAAVSSIIRITVDYCSTVDSVGAAGDNARHSGPNQLLNEGRAL